MRSQEKNQDFFTIEVSKKTLSKFLVYNFSLDGNMHKASYAFDGSIVCLSSNISMDGAFYATKVIIEDFQLKFMPVTKNSIPVDVSIAEVKTLFSSIKKAIFFAEKQYHPEIHKTSEEFEFQETNIEKKIFGEVIDDIRSQINNLEVEYKRFVNYLHKIKNYFSDQEKPGLSELNNNFSALKQKLTDLTKKIDHFSSKSPQLSEEQVAILSSFKNRIKSLQPEVVLIADILSYYLASPPQKIVYSLFLMKMNDQANELIYYFGDHNSQIRFDSLGVARSMVLKVFYENTFYDCTLQRLESSDGKSNLLITLLPEPATLEIEAAVQAVVKSAFFEIQLSYSPVAHEQIECLYIEKMTADIFLRNLRNFFNRIREYEKYLSNDELKYKCETKKIQGQNSVSYYLSIFSQRFNYLLESIGDKNIPGYELIDQQDLFSLKFDYDEYQLQKKIAIQNFEIELRNASKKFEKMRLDDAINKAKSIGKALLDEEEEKEKEAQHKKTDKSKKPDQKKSVPVQSAQKKSFSKEASSKEPSREEVEFQRSFDVLDKRMVEKLAYLKKHPSSINQSVKKEIEVIGEELQSLREFSEKNKLNTIHKRNAQLTRLSELFQKIQDGLPKDDQIVTDQQTVSSPPVATAQPPEPIYPVDYAQELVGAQHRFLSPPPAAQEAPAVVYRRHDPYQSVLLFGMGGED